MFTGLVETTGRVRAFHRAGAVYCLSIEAPDIAPELVLGQSVSVSGACLSVTALHGDSFDVDMMPETVTRTWFGASLRPGARVNLERALRLGDRLDGHMVLGHVDGTAMLRELAGNAQTREAVFSAPQELLRGIVPKGSVALDGVSLTVIAASETGFSVGLIPTTLASCTLGDLAVGMSVNLETDILGKYVERLIGGSSTRRRALTPGLSPGLSIEELRELGY
ncbi:MAG: riboflavin synthase [Fretibacterium sp.]|nr:riboflavin synthase [Fretibacterium sp.]